MTTVCACSIGHLQRYVVYREALTSSQFIYVYILTPLFIPRVLTESTLEHLKTDPQVRVVHILWDPNSVCEKIEK